jgi:putative ABC transport system substrate-binding protein
VPNLARPGGNITGFSVEEEGMGGKWLEYLKEAVPRVSRVSVVFNPDTAPYAVMFRPAMEAAAPRMGVSLTWSPIRSAGEIERAVVTAAEKPNGGLIAIADSFIFSQRATLIALASQHRLPAIYPILPFVKDGGLLAYGVDRVDLFRRAADYVDRILKGASPAELPVQQPTKFELGVNLQTAKALGLTMPQTLLLSADEVIE